MTVNEFKAWLEGFDAAINGAPTPEQWETIKAKLATVEAVNWGKLATPIFGKSPSAGDPNYGRTVIVSGEACVGAHRVADKAAGKPSWTGSART